MNHTGPNSTYSARQAGESSHSSSARRRVDWYDPQGGITRACSPHVPQASLDSNLPQACFRCARCARCQSHPSEPSWCTKRISNRRRPAVYCRHAKQRSFCIQTGSMQSPALYGILSSDPCSVRRWDNRLSQRLHGRDFRNYALRVIRIQHADQDVHRPS